MVKLDTNRPGFAGTNFAKKLDGELARTNLIEKGVNQAIKFGDAVGGPLFGAGPVALAIGAASVGAIADSAVDMGNLLTGAGERFADNKSALDHVWDAWGLTTDMGGKAALAIGAGYALYEVVDGFGDYLRARADQYRAG